jgi:signal transduction histidine kinase
MELAKVKIGRPGGRVGTPAKWFLAAVPLVLAASVYWRSEGQIDLLSPLLPPIVFASLAVNLILVGIYLYTYKFLSDDFYFFIAVFWFTIVVYTLLDVSGREYVSPSGRSSLLLLYSTSDIFLLLSLLVAGRGELARKRQRISLFVAVGLAYAGGYYWLVLLMQERGSRVSGPAWAGLLSAVSFMLLCTVGSVLRDRIGSEKPSRNAALLSYTFYLYAIIQIFPTAFMYGLGVVMVVFVSGLLAKVGQAIALQGALQFALATKAAEQELWLKQVELEVEREKFETKRQLVELGMLASSIKHDINTPLATIRLTIGALRERYQHERGIMGKLDSLQDSLEKINAIVSAVDIFRGKQPYFDREGLMTKVDMLEIVHRAVRSLKDEVGSLKQPGGKRIVVEGRSVWVRAYRPLFEQLVVNVIKNGLEAIDEAGRETGLVRVYVGAVRRPEGKYPVWAKVKIEDDGVGIPEENLGKLTTTFTTRSDKKPNSGIGLFVGKKIVDIHGGSIDFESKVGVGTKVTLNLPEWDALRRAEEAERGTGSEAETDGVETAAGSEPRAEATRP